MDASLISYFIDIFNRNKKPTHPIGEYGPGDYVIVKFAEIGVNLDGYRFEARIEEYMGSDLYAATDLRTNMKCLVETKEIIGKA